MNGSFEKLKFCPYNISPTIGTPFDAVDSLWYNPHLPVIGPGTPTLVSTPDAFHPCALVPNYLAPLNGTGYQNARTGVCYAGGVFYYPGHNPKENIAAKLIQPLQSGVKYKISMYVSLAEYHSTYAIDSIQICFSDTPILTNQFVLPPSPGIVNSNGYITDTANWVEISGEYIAQGWEQHFAIGSFKPNSSIIPFIVDSSITNKLAYYFIDDVAIYKYDTIPPSALAGNDTVICYGDSAFIGGHNYLDYYYEWSPTTTGLSCDTCGQTWARPLATTTYYVTATDFRFVKTVDSVTVYVDKCGPNAGMDKAVCIEQPFVLGDSLNFNYHCQWSPSAWLNYDTLPMPVCIPLGNITYYLTLKDSLNNIIKTDSIYVHVADCYEAEAGLDTNICKGDTLQIGSHNYAHYHYSWQLEVGSQQVYGNISDTTIGTPLVWPDTTISFFLKVIDSIGNVSYDSVLVSVMDCDTLGIAEREVFICKVFPNPAKEMVYVSFPVMNYELGIMSFELLDMFGKVVEMGLFDGSTRKYRINVQDLTEGVYILRIFGKEEIVRKKVVLIK
ncbi:T9SS type A sorting domain-containing protein [Bacteroidota bacterium]